MTAVFTFLDSPQAATDWCQQQRQLGKSIGYVPTMGALHAGHTSLIMRAKQENDCCCVSIFINPLQFNNPNDLEKYPNTLHADLRLLEKTGCDMVYTGSLHQFFPEATKTNDIVKTDPGKSALGLEGEYRPGHLTGVATIVTRLFQVVGDCQTYFGEKDFQQTLIVIEIAERLKKESIDIQVNRCTTIRENSGLALSSRNLRLNSAQREIACSIYNALLAAKIAWNKGINTPQALEAIMHHTLQHPDIHIEYVAIRDAAHWTAHSPTHPLQQPKALIAAYLNKIRLIDNMTLKSTHTQPIFRNE